MFTKYKYDKLANSLREQITEGALCPGDKLPTESELVAQFSVSRQTVRQALSLLKKDGFIETRQGSGSIIKNRFLNSDNDGASKTIAVITTYIGEYIFPDILRAIEEVLTENHYHIMVFATKNRVDNERRILSDVLEIPLAGLIVEGTKTALPNPNIDLYNKLERRGMPIVFIHASYPDLHSAVQVRADDKDGGISATEYLISNGHKRIAGIFKSDDLQGHLRYAGYTEAMLAHNLQIIDENVLWYTTESSKTISLLGIQVLAGCTAVVCYNDEVAIQLLNLLKQENVRVPDDMSVMSFDNSSFSEVSTPKISSCSQQKRQIGVLAAKKLINIINNLPQESSVLPWRVIEKESVISVNQ